MKRVFGFLCAILLLASSQVSLASIITITVNPAQDAAISANFDGFPISSGVDPGQYFMGPDVRFANSGRTEDRRPAPGVIEEVRPIMEFDLTPILSSNIYKAILRLNVHDLTNIGPDELADNAGLRVRGYDGDGLMSFDDFGSIKGSLPEPDLGFPFNPPILSDLGTISSIDTSDVFDIDVTSFVNDLLSRNIQFAGINLQVDFNSLPDRSTLPGDKTFKITITSADQGNAPLLQITHVPIPGALWLLGSGLIGLVGIRRKFRS